MWIILQLFIFSSILIEKKPSLTELKYHLHHNNKHNYHICLSELNFLFCTIDLSSIHMVVIHILTIVVLKYILIIGENFSYLSLSLSLNILHAFLIIMNLC